MAHSQPVTVLDVSNNRVTQIKTPGTDGYSAVQVTFGKRQGQSSQQAISWTFCQGCGGSGTHAQGIQGNGRTADKL